LDTEFVLRQKIFLCILNGNLIVFVVIYIKQIRD
jgi:hypothetical protein